jgi:chitinase
MKTPLPGKRSLIFCLLVLLAPLFADAQSCYNIVGYFPSWSGAASAIDYSKYSHINYSFGIPNSNGTIPAIENSGKLSELVALGHASNTKILLAIGGWLGSSPDNTPFEAIATNQTAINQFVNSCANLITQYNLDGIDIDWEYPTSQARWNALMNPLATRIHGMGKLLTAAVPAGSYYGNNYGNLAILDLVNIMSYDCSCPSNAPYSQAVDAINYWTSRGVTKEKRVLGIPFYSSDNNTNLHVQKANLAKTSAGGIMIWEISTWGDINAVYNTLGSVCKGGDQPQPTCSTVSLPGTLQAESFCYMSGIQTEATTDAGGGQNIGYIETGDWVGYKINVPSTGTYTVQYRVASESTGGQIRLESYGGGTAFGTINVPATGGWQIWQTISHTVQLTAGVQEIALAFPAGGININWFSITGGTGSTGNLALNKSVTASSTEEAQFPASFAVDGNATTRWSSGYSNTETLTVDLGATYNINRVKITWEAAYGRDYKVQGSANGSTWNDLRAVNGNTTLVNDLTGLSGSARYIRVQGVTRATEWGYSIFELEVYGSAAAQARVAEASGTVYPNPFTSTTTVSVDLPEAGPVSLRVAGTTDGQVIEVFNGYLEAGHHEITVDASSLKPGLHVGTLIYKNTQKQLKLLKK